MTLLPVATGQKQMQIPDNKSAYIPKCQNQAREFCFDDVSHCKNREICPNGTRNINPVQNRGAAFFLRSRYASIAHLLQRPRLRICGFFPIKRIEEESHFDVDSYFIAILW